MLNEQPSSKTVQDKWIAVAIWGALLAALVYTSANATVLAFGGSITSYLRSLASPAEFDNTSGVVVAIGGLAATIAVVIQLIKAWQKFGDLTHDLIAAYAKSNKSEGSNAIFSDMLVFQVPEDEPRGAEEGDGQETELDPDESESSSVSEVLRPLAYSWAIILIAPPLISVISLFLE